MPPWAWMLRISPPSRNERMTACACSGSGSPTTGVARRERFETLRATLGTSFEGIEIDSSPGNAAGIAPSAHAVLTVSLVDEPGHPTRVALDRVLAFLAEQLRH